MHWPTFATIFAEFQTYGTTEFLAISTLAMLEGLLSVDNSLVLAILVKPLPKAQRKKALTYGIVGAFVFRFIALIFAVYLAHFVAFKFIGGGYLIYLAVKHMFFLSEHHEHNQNLPVGAKSFWKIILLVELTDIAFSIDSITTAVAMSNKITVLWIGGIMGIIALRYAATFFVHLLERFPKLEDLAYQIIFFVGIKLFLEGFHFEMEKRSFWLTMGVICIIGISLIVKDNKKKLQESFVLIENEKK